MASKRLPTVADYRAAFEIVRPRMTPTQWRMLETHFLAPNHTATAGEIGIAEGRAGSTSYLTTNSAYGRFGRRTWEALGRSPPRGHVLVGIFSDFLSPDRRNPYWRFVMLRPAVQALE